MSVRTPPAKPTASPWVWKVKTMKYAVQSFVLATILSIVSSTQAQVVTKTADGFEFGGWTAAEYNTVSGKLAVADSASPETQSKRSLAITPTYAGSFGGFGAAPTKPLVISGETKSVTVISK